MMQWFWKDKVLDKEVGSASAQVFIPQKCQTLFLNFFVFLIFETISFKKDKIRARDSIYSLPRFSKGYNFM